MIMSTQLRYLFVTWFLAITIAHAEDGVRLSGETYQGRNGQVLESGALREGNDELSCAHKALYRKKIAILDFPLQQPRDAADLRHVSDGLALLLEKRLRSNFVTQTFPWRKAPHDLPQSELHRLWLNRGFQFAIYARMEDMAMLYAGQTSRFQSPLGPSFHKGKRGLVATLHIHDLLTGQLISTVPYATTVSGSDYFSQPVSILGQEFLTSSYGQNVQTMLDEFASQVDESLRCLPFMTRIIDVRGEEIILDAGRLHGLKAGDRLLVHHQRETILKSDAPYGEGKVESPIATLTLTEVQPDMAVGLIEPGSAIGRVTKGDIARAQ
jgi:hypothetical protein